MAKLTEKQEKFCIKYNECGNASEAYRAVYNCSKSKPETINRKAKELMDNGKIAARLKELNQAAVTSSIMTKNEALEILSIKSRIKMTDVADFKQSLVGEDENGQSVYQTIWQIKNAEDIAPEIAVCIKSITVTKTGPKIELYDSTASTKLMSDILGWNAPIETNSNVNMKNDWHIHPTSSAKDTEQE